MDDREFLATVSINLAIVTKTALQGSESSDFERKSNPAAIENQALTLGPTNLSMIHAWASVHAWDMLGLASCEYSHRSREAYHCQSGFSI